MAKKTCSITGCGNGAKTRGFCGAHYARFLRHGDPLGGRQLGRPQEFIATVVISYEKDDCLIWPFRRDNYGYGRIDVDGWPRLAHRVICGAVFGVAPEDKEHVAHSCGKGHLGCVNPRHLAWSSQAANNGDMVKHGTSTRGKRNSQVKLTEHQVREIRSIGRSNSKTHIAQMFDVSRATVRAILCGENWGWLDEGQWTPLTQEELDRMSYGNAYRGSSNPSSKLTEHDVRRIRSMAGEQSLRAIAEQFGVTPKTVAAVINRRNWAWLK